MQKMRFSNTTNTTEFNCNAWGKTTVSLQYLSSVITFIEILQTLSFPSALFDKTEVLTNS